MNITELRLLAYKKRNWQYTFIKLAPMNTEIMVDPDELKVNLFEKETLVIVQGKTDAQIQSAMTMVLGVIDKNPNIYFYVKQPYVLNNNTELQIIAPELDKINIKNNYALTSYLTTELGVMEKIELNAFNTSRIKTTLETWMSSAELIKINTSMNGMIVDATGSLDIAKVAKLQDYAPFALSKIAHDYDNWFGATTLDKLHYSLY